MRGTLGHHDPPSRPARRRWGCVAARCVALVAGGGVFLVPALGGAHSFQRSFSDLKPYVEAPEDGGEGPGTPAVSAFFDVDPDDFDDTLRARFDADRSGQVELAELEANAQLLAGVVLAGNVVSRGGTRCTGEVLRAQVSLAAQMLRTTLRYRCPKDGPLAVEVALLERMRRGHVHLMTVRLPEGTQSVALGGETRGWAEAPRPSSWRSMIRFFVLGVEHIAVGYDHLLFLLGLLVMAAGLRDVVQLVTAFTVAHSITLVAATVGMVDLPASLVEPAIALSIAAVGIQNLAHLRAGRPIRHRWALVFALGLLHGLGFAGVLGELGLPATDRAWPLASFNLGVEAGQLVVVALVIPALRNLQAPETPRTTLALIGAGGAVAAAGLAWLDPVIGAGVALLTLLAVTLTPRLGFRRVILQGGSALLVALGLVWWFARL